MAKDEVNGRDKGLIWSGSGQRLRIVVEPNRFVGALFLGFSIVVAGGLWKVGAAPSGLASWIFLLPPLGCFYLGLVASLNRKTLEIGPDEIRVSITPFPWPGGVKLDRRSVSGFALEKKVRLGENGHNVSYTLAAQVREGGTRPLLKGLPKKTAKQALALVTDFGGPVRKDHHEVLVPGGGSATDVQ